MQRGLGTGRKIFQAWASVVSQALNLVSPLAYTTAVQKGLKDCSPSLLPLTQHFMSKVQHSDFIYGDILEPARTSRYTPDVCSCLLHSLAVLRSSNTHLPLALPTGVSGVCFLPLHLLFLGVSEQVKVLEVGCNLFLIASDKWYLFCTTHPVCEQWTNTITFITR